jgi:rod shape-determining protein MreB and related proteins
MSFMGKTSEFPVIRALRNLVSDSMAIDMGSASTIISVRGRGVVVDEPSLVAVDTTTGEVIAAGFEAQQKYGREARGVKVIAPLIDGVVADFERSKEMLAHFVRKARGSVSYFSREAVISVFSDVTPVELRALLGAAEHARLRRVEMIEEGLAAAFGSGVRTDDHHGSAVVDIGAGTTSIAIVASGKIVHAHAQRIGSSDIDAAIINHVRRHRGLLIGPQTAERLKLELASAVVPVDLAHEIPIKGRDVLSGIPNSVEITAGEIYPVAEEMVRKIVQGISTTLTELPPEVAGDIYDRGIILTGGGAQFGGLDEYLRDQTKLPVRIAEEPRYAIVRGLEQMLEEPISLGRIIIREEPQAELEPSSGSL